MKRNLTVRKRNLTVRKRNLIFMKRNLTVMKRNLTVMKRNLTVMKRNLTVVKRNLTALGWYAASLWDIERLPSRNGRIRDGIGTSLARLFEHATRTPAKGAAGAERARSASEAFIFRRLETLPALAG